MQGEKAEQEDLFYYGSLDALVPADDPYRRLDALLDLSWLRAETRNLYSQVGRPSVDPVVIVKLMLIFYLQGFDSERELMRQIRVNLSYRRFVHYSLSESLPDHSNLTRARQRLGEATLSKAFAYVLQLCVDAGLVGGELESIDSTFVQADASLASLGPRLIVVEAERFTRKLFVVGSDAEGQDSEPESPLPPPGPGAPFLVTSDREGEAGVPEGPASERPSDQAKKGKTNDAYVSRTDPESGIYTRSGLKTRLGFLVHFAVDRGKQIITGVLTTGAQHRDVGQIVPLVDQVLGRGIAVQAVAADRGYSSGEVYRELASRDVEAFIPLLDKSRERQGYFGREHFSYEAASDSYICDKGARLKLAETRDGARRYKARAQDCGPCPLRTLCTGGAARTLRISRYEAELAAARRVQETRQARRAARDRRICSERTFAEAKDNHGLRRAHCRGLANMAIQALLTATAINLKRYLQAQTRAFPAAAALRRSVFADFSSAYRGLPRPQALYPPPWPAS